VIDRRPSRHLWVVQLVCALIVPCAKSHSQSPNLPSIVQIKLEQYGWQRLPPPVRHEAWPTVANLMRVDSKGRVLVGYPAREIADLAIRGNPKLTFHVLRFMPDGKLNLSLSLPTDNLADNAVFVDVQDHIFLVANGTLQVLTGDDQTPAQQRTWKPLTSCSWSSQYCQVRQSPTHRSLFIWKCPGPAQSKLCEQPDFTAYDTSSSEPKVLVTCTGRHGGTTDKFGYSWGWQRRYFTRRHTACSSNTPEELPIDDPVCAVLNDDLFVVDRLGKGKRWEVGTVTAHGNTKFRLELPKHDMPALNMQYVKGDATGDRFAFVIDTLRGGNSALDIAGHLTARRVAVYDSHSGTQLTSINVYPPVPRYGVRLGIIPGFTFDLSPDGHILAVLSEGMLIITKLE
jgi:hypothetical protein